MFQILLFASSALLVAADCNCGYYDPSTGNLFTERLILYFNETMNFPAEVLSIQTYEDGYEKGWNSRYRNGANVSNVRRAASTPSTLYQSSTSLELALSPSDKKHLVMGGGVRSLRQDIQWGSFRPLIRPSQPWLGGSAMSMNVEFNETQSISMSSMNADAPDAAWVNTLLADEFPVSLHIGLLPENAIHGLY